MKVLHLSSEKSWRGGEQQIAYLIEELEQNGVSNYVACRKNSAFEKYCIQKQINLISLSFANQFDLYTAWQIRNFCREFEIDLVHMHSAHSHATGVFSSILGNPAGLVLSRRVDFPVKNNWFSKFKYNYSGIRKIICVSKAIKQMTQAGIKQPEKCKVIYSGIDRSKFANSQRNKTLHKLLGIPEDTKIIANVSAIAPHKDYPTFVDVASKFKHDQPFKFVIIGDGPDRQQIENYVREKGLESTVLFTGFVDNIPEVIKDIDVLLITSKTEGLGTTILDAFANRIPVVGTAGGGIPELVIHHETGWLAEVGNSDQLCACLKEIFDDSELVKKIIEVAEMRLEAEFTKQKTAKLTFETYLNSL